MRDAGCLRTYVPVDISEEITHETARVLVEEYPGLAVRGLVCDFEHHLERIPDHDGDRLIAFLGGTVGNLYPDQRAEFLERIAALLGPGDHLLLGTDLIKDAARLQAAYDDADGVTAEFNKNVLQVLNRELGGDFDLDAFDHVARYDAVEERMDIRLRSQVDQTVTLDDIDLEIRVRRRGGDADRDLDQVHPRAPGGGLPGGGPGDERLVHRCRRRLRALAGPAGGLSVRPPASAA